MTAQLPADARPFELLAALHAWRGMAPTALLTHPWSEDIGAGWVFHMNGHHSEARLCPSWRGGESVCLPRHLLVFRDGEPALLIDPTGGWGQQADRDAFTARLAVFLDTLKGEVA